MYEYRFIYSYVHIHTHALVLCLTINIGTLTLWYFRIAHGFQRPKDAKLDRYTQVEIKHGRPSNLGEPTLEPIKQFAYPGVLKCYRWKIWKALNGFVLKGFMYGEGIEKSFWLGIRLQRRQGGNFLGPDFYL